QGLQAVHAVLRRLDGDVVTDTIFWIEPETGSRLEAGTERDKNVLGDVARLQPDVLCACAVDIEVKRGRVKGLLYMNVDSARNVAQISREFFREQIVALLVGDRAEDRNVDRSGRAESQNLSEDVSGLEIKLNAGETLRKFSAQLVDVFGGSFGAVAF